MKKVQRAFAVVADDHAFPLHQVQERLMQAFACHQSGDLNGAAQGYQEVIAMNPQQADAWHLMGVLAHQLGDFAGAVGLIERAREYDNTNVDSANNLGNARLANGDVFGAARAYREVIALDASNADAHYNLANVLQRMSLPQEALVEYDAAISLRPYVPAFHFNQANLLFNLDDLEGAVAAFERVRQLDPNFPSLQTNLGAAYARLERWDDALVALEQAVRQNGFDVHALHNYGAVLNRFDRHEDAVEILGRALDLQPTSGDTRRQLIRALIHVDLIRAYDLAKEGCETPEVEAEDYYLYGSIQLSHGLHKQAVTTLEHALSLDADMVYGSHHLGAAYTDEGRLDDAIAFYEASIARFPKNGLNRTNLGLALKDAGRLEEGLERMREGLRLAEDSAAHSNYIFSLCYSDQVTSLDILRDSRAWSELYTPVDPPRPAMRSREGRKLRIGYVSADFHRHPAGYLYEAMFPLHDRSRFDITVYANQLLGDDVTQRICESADRWYMTRNMSDARFVEQVQTDEIDVLIDLLGHTNHNRLTAFGMRPAPVQATWLGYFNTTGMPQMDFIVSDETTLPSGEEAFYTERPARMPGCMYVFQPPKLGIPTGAPAVHRNGHITFGCFNNTAKITRDVVALWSEVLRAIPDAQLVLNRWPFRSGVVRDRYLAMFAEEGISSERIELRATNGRDDYFAGYYEVDIMLDTFPFGGGTTTSEALWMGVPVVSLPADRLVGHMTETILRAVDLPELLVSSRVGYVELAQRLANDPAQLMEYRTHLRAQVENSRLCDLPRFTAEFEDLFEWMFDNV